MEPTYYLAPSWLVNPVGRVLHRYRIGQGFKSCTGLIFFFSRLVFITAQVMVFLTNESANKAEINILSARDTTRPGP